MEVKAGFRPESEDALYERVRNRVRKSSETHVRRRQRVLVK